MFHKRYWSQILHKHWPFLYFLLAAIDIAALIITLLHSRENFEAYDTVVKQNAQHLQVLELYGKLAESARKVNAPGNDIFQSRNPSREITRYLSSLQEFNEHLKKLENTINSETQKDALEINLKLFQSLKFSYVRLQQATVKIFFSYQENNLNRATFYMAEMDQAHGKLVEAIESLRSEQLHLQYANIQASQASLQAGQSFEAYFSIILLISVLGVTYYGSRLSRFIRRSQEQDNEFRQIYQALNTSAIVARTDRSGRITEVNENFCSISGYTKEELIGKNHRLINSKTHSPKFFKELWSTISKGKIWSGSIQNRRKDGSLYTVKTVISPIRNTDDEIKDYLSIRFDITDQIKVKQDLIEAQSIAKIGSWTFDPQKKKLSWSAEQYRIFEISPTTSDESLLSQYLERLDENGRKEISNFLSTKNSASDEFLLDHKVILQNGARIKYVRCMGKFTFNSDGTPIQISGTCQDLSELIFTQEKLRSSIDFNEVILKNAKHSIITTDLNGTITGFNPEAERILEFKAEEMIGKCSPAVFHDPREVASVAEILSTELCTEVPIGFETFIAKAKIGKHDERVWTYISKSGKRIPVRLSITALMDNNGDIRGYMGIGKDISEFLEIQKNLNYERARATHAAKLASLGEVSAGIAHEINNPLAIISGNVNLLQRYQNDPGKFLEKVETILKSVNRIEKIVKSLKKFSRSNVGSVRKLEPLSKIISESITLTEAKAKKFQVPIKVNVNEEFQIYCDQVEIEQVLVNLISNSIDAVKNLSEKWIEIQASNIGEDIRIFVIDSGTGISSALEEKLFQPFFTTKPIGEGTGLGLSISKGILEEHQAQISLNRSHKNTCFEIRFPKQLDSSSSKNEVA